MYGLCRYLCVYSVCVYMYVCIYIYIYIYMGYIGTYMESRRRLFRCVGACLKPLVADGARVPRAAFGTRNSNNNSNSSSNSNSNSNSSSHIVI